MKILAFLLLGGALFGYLALAKYPLPKPTGAPSPTLNPTAIRFPTVNPKQPVEGRSSLVAETGAGTLYEYTAPKLGISFRYLSSEELMVHVFGTGNTVCVTYDRNDLDCQRGQYIQIFQKDPKETLAAAISRTVLSGIKPEECFVTPLERGPDARLSGFEYAEISFPPSEDPNIPDVFGPNANNCPEQYRKTSTIRYFSLSTTRPDRFFFFNIGQSIIPGEDNKPWDQTLMVR